MAIDYSAIRGITAGHIITALLRDGFSVARSKGATRFFKHEDGRRVTLHVHNLSQTLPIGTLREIIENEAQWNEDILRSLPYLKEKHMHRRAIIAKNTPPDFVHVITGEWATKTIHIDGELVTPDMLRERVLEDEEDRSDERNDYQGAWGIDVFENVRTFNWGRRCKSAHMLSIAWIFWLGGIDLHDWVFYREIIALPRADFTYRYPRSRMDQDQDQGGVEFAQDFKRVMKERGAH